MSAVARQGDEGRVPGGGRMRRTCQRVSVTRRVVLALRSSGPVSVMCSMTVARRAWTRLRRAREESLNVLVNNAVSVRPEREARVDGVELTFATNVVGYYMMNRPLEWPADGRAQSWRLATWQIGITERTTRGARKQELAATRR